MVRALEHLDNPRVTMTDGQATAFVFGIRPMCEGSDSPIVNAPLETMTVY